MNPTTFTKPNGQTRVRPLRWSVVVLVRLCIMQSVCHWGYIIKEPAANDFRRLFEAAGLAWRRSYDRRIISIRKNYAAKLTHNFHSAIKNLTLF